MTTPVLPKYIGPDTSTLDRKMSNEEIKARFDAETAAVYSQRQPLWLPEFGYAVRLILAAIKPYLASKRPASMLDLGAGTGNLSRRVLGAFKNSHVTLVDFSPNMLAEVPNVLSAYDGRYEIRMADFWQVNFPAATFDAIVTSFALHHGRGEAVYLELYRKACRWLKSEGVFACCDVIEGDVQYISEINEAGWRRFLQRRNFTGEEIERIFSNYHREDSPLSLRQHLALLVEAGFSSADVLWKRFNFAMYVGLKS
jgi:tRNA (cmo5U34)-methyltransferase